AARGVAAPAAAGAGVAALVGAILQAAACRRLGSDLRSAADEILRADGLTVGEGRAQQRGGAEEWDAPLDEPESNDLDLFETGPAELEEPPPDLPAPDEDEAPENLPDEELPGEELPDVDLPGE